jgi:hypothetical protein
MDAAELKQWLGSVVRLTPVQKAELPKALSARDDEAEVGQLVDSWTRGCRGAGGLSPLPRHGVVRNRSASGLQRYKCRGCQRTINALSKTPLYDATSRLTRADRLVLWIGGCKPLKEFTVQWVFHDQMGGAKLKL